MRLLVLDSKAKADTLRPLLGASWEVIVVSLPLRTLPPRTIGIDAQGQLTYQLTENGQRALELMAQWMAPGAVWIATDPGEAGDAQAWHVREVLRRPDARRLVLEELTAAGLRRALRQTCETTNAAAAAAEVEQAVDRMTGAMCDLAMRAAYPGEVQCAGRRPHSILALLLQREREARLSKRPEVSHACLQFPGFTARLDAPPSDGVVPSPEAYTKATWFVRDVRSERRVEPAPAPFNLRSLILAAFEVGITPANALSAALDLYRAGLLTYPVTEAESIDALSRSSFVSFAKGQQWPVGENTSRGLESSELASPIHAIRVTSLKPPPAFATPVHARIFMLVLRRCLASVLQCAVLERHTVTLEAIVNGPKGVASVRAHGTVERPVIRGWRHACGESRDEPPEVNLSVGSTVSAQAWLPASLASSQHQRYDLATLAEAADKQSGMSFRSVLASLDYLQKRELIQWRDRTVQPTGRGVATAMAAEALRLPVGDLRFARSVDDQIDSIRTDHTQASAVLARIHAMLHRRLSLSARKCPPFQPCPVCGEAFVDQRAPETQASAAPLEALHWPSLPSPHNEPQPESERLAFSIAS